MAGTRLAPELDLDGLPPDEAFSILGNEIRLDIVRVLWRVGAFHEYEEDFGDAETAVSFSELRRRVDVDDNGQFNYHLSKLVPYFVRETDDGYRLSDAGKKIARTVIAVSGEQTPDVSSELDAECPLCGAPITATYEDQWLRFLCTECDGLFGDTTPEGSLLDLSFPAARLADHTVESLYTTGLYRCQLDTLYMMHGICRECAGPLSSSLSVCEEHDASDGEPCEVCNSQFEVWGEKRCRTCQFAKRLPIQLWVMGFIPVIGFLYNHDADVPASSLEDIVSVLDARFETRATTDPDRVTVTIEAGDGEFTVTLDNGMTVVDMSS